MEQVPTERGCIYISLTRIVVFIIGLILALVGLFLVTQNLHDIFSLVVGGVMIVIGIIILSGRGLTL